MIDTHAHLTCDELYFQVDSLIQRAKNHFIEKIINIATDEKTLERGILLQERETIIKNVAATTPHDVEKEGEYFFPFVENACMNRSIIAIGETGLDYYYEHSPKSLQKEFFERYIELAIHFNLPLVIHCRDAFSDLFSILDRYHKQKKVLIHCFTGNQEEANEAIKRGYVLSFSGILTYKKSVELQEVFKQVPLNQIVAETDSPYLAPQSKRGKSNEPAYIEETIQKMAELKGIELAEIRQITTQNAKRFFSI